MSEVYNFNPGPATLPAEVMSQAREEFCDYQGLGYGIMEASHRSPEFAEVIGAAEANIRKLLDVPESYAVLFLQGGASTQFTMLPMNLAAGGCADYADTGSWSAKAIKEAKKLTDTHIAASSKDGNYMFIPGPGAWSCRADAAYLHITSNNTIAGTQYHQFPETPEGVRLAADMSSDILSRRLPLQDFAVIYAGAQKNLGPSGVTLVIIDRELADRAPADLPTMLSYRTHIDKESLFNTPPSFSIYMVRLVTDWLLGLGGLDAVEARNDSKADALYAAIDADDFFRCPVEFGSRSKMNVCFRLPSEELEAEFLAEAKEAGLIGLKGHRSVGGVRASIYNAMPAAGVRALVAFMDDFRRRRG